MSTESVNQEAIEMLESFRDGRLEAMEASHQTILGDRSTLAKQALLFNWAVGVLKEFGDQLPAPSAIDVRAQQMTDFANETKGVAR